MKRRFRSFQAGARGQVARTGVLLLFGAAMSGASTRAEAAPRRPNILIIVADDLGYSDLGAFGGEISTPNLDRLARSGTRLIDFHTAPTCSPTRSMLLTGTDNHLAGLGSMAEQLLPNQTGQPGYEGFLRKDVATLAERLGGAGYRTMMSGKWHLGRAAEHDPHARGFAASFALLPGSHNHFGIGLSTDRLRGATYTENGAIVTKLPANFYSSDTFAEKLVEQLARTKAARAEAPFFAYLAFTAPHWPLHAPAGTVAKYRGRYDAGFEALRLERIRRQRALGLFPKGAEAHPLTLPDDQRWETLTPAERSRQSRSMEVYAAMVDRMDQAVGKVLAHLESTGELDNTIVFFMSDNGPEGLDLYTTAHQPFKQRAFYADNRLDSIGTAASAWTYGPGWAQASAGALSKFKGYQTEGGIRVPAFLVVPGKKGRDRISGIPSTVMDVAPTMLELARVADVGRSGQNAAALQPIRGTSLATNLMNPSAGRPSAIAAGEVFGRRYVRQGQWKLIHPGVGEGDWQLFDLETDPGEAVDLAGFEPKRLQSMLAAWKKYAEHVGVVLPESRFVYP